MSAQAPDSAATDTLSLSAGARVRADAFINTCVRPTELRGDVVMVRRDTLIMALRETTDTTALTMGQVDRLFVTDGSRARGADAWRWGAMGVGLGIAAAAITEMGACKPGEQCGAIAPKLVIGGAAGGAAGFLLGQFRTQERWTPVAIPRSLRGERICPSTRPFRFP